MPTPTEPAGPSTLQVRLSVRRTMAVTEAGSDKWMAFIELATARGISRARRSSVRTFVPAIWAVAGDRLPRTVRQADTPDTSRAMP